jgi:excinuclease ABC subunit C
MIHWFCLAIELIIGDTIMTMKEKIKTYPITSGVYLMKNEAGVVIYVGKAVSLQKRLLSYFRPANQLDAKTRRLMRDVCDIEYRMTASEAEAFILEASLIKEHAPRYNIDLKDDKSYPFVEITGEEFPRIMVVRPRVKNAASKYYGPYINPRSVREALGIMRRVFPYRSCNPLGDKECLDFHLGLCDAPCVGKISEEQYRRRIHDICLILEGKKDELFKELTQMMEDFSRRQDFEKAAVVRDQLQALGALYSGTKDINYYKEAEQLERAFNLPRLPIRIETLDISNIMGKNSVGSMVSFLNGKPDKNNYRRFKIKEVECIDDFQMIAEVVRRRYKRLKKEGKTYPDLIVIDGGKGQLSAAQEELKKLGIDIPMISLAKREEEVFVPGKRNSVKFPKDSLGIKLLQRVRDEAHRFAVKYHRLLRGKEFIK